LPEFPTLARKNFGPLLVRIFSHEDLIGRHFFKSKHVRRHFSNKKTLGAIFQIKRRWAPFLLVFSEFAQIFRDFTKVFTDFFQISLDFARIFRDFVRIFTNQNFWGCTCTPCTLASCTTGFVCKTTAAEHQFKCSPFLIMGITFMVIGSFSSGCNTSSFRENFRIFRQKTGSCLV